MKLSSKHRAHTLLSKVTLRSVHYGVLLQVNFHPSSLINILKQTALRMRYSLLNVVLLVQYVQESQGSSNLRATHSNTQIILSISALVDPTNLLLQITFLRTTNFTPKWPHVTKKPTGRILKKQELRRHTLYL